MNLKEDTISSEVVFSGRLVSLRVDRVRLPNGLESTREVVVHRGAVAAVPLLDGNHIQMVRQFRQAAGQTLLEIPAGTLEEGEEPVECVRRELVEEIGLRPGRLRLMFSSYLAPGYSSEMLHTFLADEMTPAHAESDPDEFIEVVSVPLDDAVAMITSGEIVDAKTICGILMAKRLLYY